MKKYLREFFILMPIYRERNLLFLPVNGFYFVAAGRATTFTSQAYFLK